VRLDPCPQQRIDLALEIVGGGKIAQRHPVGTLIPGERAIEERLEPRPFQLRAFELGRIVDRHAQPLGLAQNNDVRELGVLARLDRSQDLACRDAGIGLTGRHGRAVGRQLGTKLGPEEREHNVAVGRRGNILEIRIFAVEFETGLRADRLDPHDPSEFAVEPLDDALDAPALTLDIIRRCHEQSNRTHLLPPSASQIVVRREHLT
jgi:hypothetical protein